MTVEPNSRDVTAFTRGIARKLDLDGIEAPDGAIAAGLGLAPELEAGGGNLNGSNNTAHLAGHAGTGADRVSVPRASVKVGSGNYCGVV
jgi:hypothetical protein